MITCVFRADASVIIGSGHVMRCLTLADVLREQGFDAAFICRELPGNMCETIEKKGYLVHRLPYSKNLHQVAAKEVQWLGESWQRDAEQVAAILEGYGVKRLRWLIVDHYGLDLKWEQRLRSYVRKMLVIDDLANRRHDCNIILDQNLHLNMEDRYEGLAGRSVKYLLGPKFAMLRPEFIAARRTRQMRTGEIRRLFIFFGGSDPTNETKKALEAVQALTRSDIRIDVVVGAINPNKTSVKELCERMPNVTFHCGVDNMAELMANADLAIGAGGTASWERCCVGIPSIVVAIAENQYSPIRCLEQLNAIKYCGRAEENSSAKILAELQLLTSSPETVSAMSKAAMGLVDGCGTERVMKEIIKEDKHE